MLDYAAGPFEESVVGRVYPLSEVAQAWHDVQSQKIEGKTVFAVSC